MEPNVKPEELNLRQKQSLHTEKKILRSAVHVLNELGHENFNVKNICQEAGISIGGFYHHFKSVEALVARIYNVNDAFEELEYSPLTGTAPERVLRILKLQAKYITSLGVGLLIQYYKGIFNHIDEKENYYIQEFQEIINMVEEALLYGQMNGELSKDIDCKDAAQTLVQMSRGFIFNWCTTNGGIDLINSVQSMAKLYLDSIKSNEG